MADFDESAIRSPRTPPQTIGVGEVEPWTVWTAAGALVILAVVGLVMGVRGGHPLSGVGMSLETGATVDASATRSAAPAQAMPKDPQWSTLSGPEVVVKSAAPPKVAAAQDDQSDDAEHAGDDDHDGAQHREDLGKRSSRPGCDLGDRNHDDHEGGNSDQRGESEASGKPGRRYAEQGESSRVEGVIDAERERHDEEAENQHRSEQRHDRARECGIRKSECDQ